MCIRKLYPKYPYIYSPFFVRLCRIINDSYPHDIRRKSDFCRSPHIERESTEADRHPVSNTANTNIQPHNFFI